MAHTREIDEIYKTANDYNIYKNTKFSINFESSGVKLVTMERDADINYDINHCIKNQQLPIYFRADLESFGIEYGKPRSDYIWSQTPVTLPEGWKLVKMAAYPTIGVVDSGGSCVYAMRLKDDKTWKRDEI